jgi:hypothetical protein
MEKEHIEQNMQRELLEGETKGIDKKSDPEGCCSSSSTLFSKATLSSSESSLSDKMNRDASLEAASISPSSSLKSAPSVAYFGREMSGASLPGMILPSSTLAFIPELTLSPSGNYSAVSSEVPDSPLSISSSSSGTRLDVTPMSVPSTDRMKEVASENDFQKLADAFVSSSPASGAESGASVSEAKAVDTVDGSLSKGGAARDGNSPTLKRTSMSSLFAPFASTTHVGPVPTAPILPTVTHAHFRNDPHALKTPPAEPTVLLAVSPSDITRASSAAGDESVHPFPISRAQSWRLSLHNTTVSADPKLPEKVFSL